MKRRILATVLSVVFAVGMISGCGSTEAPAPASTAAASSEAVSSVEASGEASTEASTASAEASEATSAASAEASDEGQLPSIYTEDVSYPESPAVGVLMDGAMHTYTVKFPGATMTFDLGDDTKSDLADGVQVGKAYVFTFDSSTADPSAQTMHLQEIKDSDTQPSLSPEVMDSVCQAVMAFENMDLETLSSFIKYPAYVGVDGGVTVKSADEFKALDSDKVFTDDLWNEVEAADFTKLEAVEAGIVIGDNGHTLIFDKDGSGITGINP